MTILKAAHPSGPGISQGLCFFHDVVTFKLQTAHLHRDTSSERLASL